VAHTISAVTTRPVMPHQNRLIAVKLLPLTVKPVLMEPKIQVVTGHSAIADRIPVTIRPLYSAPMMFWDAPSLTK
jgi:hypothetical protein